MRFVQHRSIKQRLLVPAAGLLAAIGIAACSQTPSTPAAAPAPSAEDQAKAQVEHGRLLISRISARAEPVHRCSPTAARSCHRRGYRTAAPVAAPSGSVTGARQAPADAPSRRWHSSKRPGADRFPPSSDLQPKVSSGEGSSPRSNPSSGFPSRYRHKIWYRRLGRGSMAETARTTKSCGQTGVTPQGLGIWTGFDAEHRDRHVARRNAMWSACVRHARRSATNPVAAACLAAQGSRA